MMGFSGGTRCRPPHRWFHKPEYQLALDLLGPNDLVGLHVGQSLHFRPGNLSPSPSPGPSSLTPKIDRRPTLSRTNREDVPLNSPHSAVVLHPSLRTPNLRADAAIPRYLHSTPPRNPIPLFPSLPPGLRKRAPLLPAANRPNIPRTDSRYVPGYINRPDLAKTLRTSSPQAQFNIRTRIPSPPRHRRQPARPHRALLVRLDHVPARTLDPTNHRIGFLRHGNATGIQRNIHLHGGSVPRIRRQRSRRELVRSQRLCRGFPAL